MRVFISYAREDTEFVDKLAGALVRHGFEPQVDRKILTPLDGWEKQLARTIRKADVGLFVLSPEWVESSTCAWELSEVTRLGKRLAPVLYRQPAQGTVPQALSSIQYFSFSEADAFEDKVQALAAALNTDSEWVLLHSRYQDLAHRWKELAQPDSHCLKGKELKQAVHWLRAPPSPGAASTALQVAYIRRSKWIESFIYTLLHKHLPALGTTIAAAIESAAAPIGRGLHAVASLAARKLYEAIVMSLRGISNGIIWVLRHHWKPVLLTSAVLGPLLVYREEVLSMVHRWEESHGYRFSAAAPARDREPMFAVGNRISATVRGKERGCIQLDLAGGVRGQVPEDVCRAYSESLKAMNVGQQIEVRVLRVDHTSRQVVVGLH